jgi:hypothetical protein
VIITHINAFIFPLLPALVGGWPIPNRGGYESVCEEGMKRDEVTVEMQT